MPGRNSKFQRYYTWFQGAQGTTPERSGIEQPLFPGVLPYPEVLSECGGALLDDEAAEFWGKSLLNEFVAWSNFVVLGCPECRDGRFEPRVVHRSMEDMRSFADRLLGEVVSFSTPELLRDTLCCEGKRGDLQSLLELLSCSTSSYDDVGPQVSPEAGVALPVVAERVAVPAEAGLVDPADWLEPDRAAVFENLDRLRLPEELWGEKVVACHRVPLDQEEAVIRKLLETNMVTLVPEGELPRDGQGDIRVGGLFSVRKNDVEDRLIYDRRPENATMPRLRWAELPNGACYCRLLLKPHEYVRGSGDDLRNFYYMLRLPEAWIRFNSVGRRVSKELLVERGLDPSIAHRACFRVLGMGDVNGCAIAQATHESILRRAGLLEPDTVLIYGRTAPQSDLWEGIYLDDLLVTLRCQLDHPVPQDGSFKPPLPMPQDEDMRRMAAAEAAYLEARLRRAEHKAFRGEVQFRAWGAEIDGVKGRCGTSGRPPAGVVSHPPSRAPGALHSGSLAEASGADHFPSSIQEGDVLPAAPHLQVHVGHASSWGCSAPNFRAG